MDSIVVSVRKYLISMSLRQSMLHPAVGPRVSDSMAISGKPNSLALSAAANRSDAGLARPVI